MNELDDLERFERQKKVADYEKRTQDFDRAVTALFSRANALIREMKNSECGYIASSLENGMIDFLLRLNYSMHCFENELEKLQPPDSEPLECRLCKKKGFWHC